MSIFRSNKKKVDKGFKKMDKIVTWLFLWSVIASVYGIKKHENEKKNEFFKIHSKPTKKLTAKEIIKWIIFWADHITDEKKPGFVKSVYLFLLHMLKSWWKK